MILLQVQRVPGDEMERDATADGEESWFEASRYGEEMKMHILGGIGRSTERLRSSYCTNLLGTVGRYPAPSGINVRVRSSTTYPAPSSSAVLTPAQFK